MDPSSSHPKKSPILAEKSMNLMDFPSEILFKISEFVSWKELSLLKRINRRFYNILTANEHRTQPLVIDLVSIETGNLDEALVIFNIDGKTKAHLLTDLNANFFNRAIIKKIINNPGDRRDLDEERTCCLDWLSRAIVHEYVHQHQVYRDYNLGLQHLWTSLRTEFYTFSWHSYEKQKSLRVPSVFKRCFDSCYAHPCKWFYNADAWTDRIKLEDDEMMLEFVKALHRGQIRLQGEGSVSIRYKMDDPKSLLQKINGYLRSFEKFTTNQPELKISERDLVLFFEKVKTIEMNRLISMKLMTRPSAAFIETNLYFYGTGYLIQ